MTAVALVNRFAPPDAAPTAVALDRLARLLAARLPGLELNLIGARRVYGGGGGAAGETLWRRAAASWRDGGRLAQAAAGHDVVLSLTDPPLLRRHIARRLPPGRLWIEWTMDLYPQAFWAALGLRPAFHAGRMGNDGARRPDLFLRLGPRQAAATAGGASDPAPCLLLPAGVIDAPIAGAPPPHGPINLVYAGNLGRAHWPEALLLLARACDPARFRLIVAAYGAHAPAVKAALAAFPHVEWRDRPLSDADLNAADVHVVSLRENWTHVCVPSKAISALSRGRPILFFGAAASDVWAWADGAGLRIDPDRAAAADGLPDALAQLATPDRLAALTRRAQAAGDRLRRTESAAVDALAARLSRPAA